MKSTDVIPLVVYGFPLVGLLVVSLLKPNAARIVYALVVFVLVGGGINFTVSFAHRGILFFLGITPIMMMTLPSIIGAAGKDENASDTQHTDLRS